MSLRPLRSFKNQNSTLQNENLPRDQRKGIGTRALKANGKEKSTVGAKRKADSENYGPLKVSKKRSAFGDITNAFEKTLHLNKKPDGKNDKESIKAKSTKCQKPDVKNDLTKIKSTKYQDVPAVILLEKNGPLEDDRAAQKSINKGTKVAESQDKISFKSSKIVETCKNDSLDDSILILSQELNNINKVAFEESCNYITASEGSPLEKADILSCKVQLGLDHSRPPPGVEDFDNSCKDDPFAVSLYAMDVFNYYKERENFFSIEKYISRQPDVTKSMRSILVDWMVEVQESFELNHETLYLAVKLVDMYLSKVIIKRDKLQLVGSTALFIACKFDERLPPYIDDFLYICDDAYKRKELILLEIEMLKTFGFDIGIPLSYRFLRRYARCGKVSMETLTFARFILELSLMDYDFIEVRDSILAAAALYLALSVHEKVYKWSDTMKYYSGYDQEDISHVVQMLHQMLTQPAKDHLKTIRTKYSHKIFYEVGKIKIPEYLELEA